MQLNHSIDTPLRDALSWEERWAGSDKGLIACWERGRQKRLEAPELALQAEAGRLIVLPWKGGVDEKKIPKGKRKIGTMFYLAMLQGMRGEDLKIDTDSETELTCSTTGVTVTYTFDFVKYSGAGVESDLDTTTTKF